MTERGGKSKSQRRWLCLNSNSITDRAHALGEGADASGLQNADASEVSARNTRTCLQCWIIWTKCRCSAALLSRSPSCWAWTGVFQLFTATRSGEVKERLFGAYSERSLDFACP